MAAMFNELVTSFETITRRLLALETRAPPKDGVDGKEGAPGQKGMDGAPGLAGAAGRDGVDGKDGVPGAAGADGKDGRDGKDGADGFGLDDIDCVFDGERTLTFSFSRGELRRERSIVLRGLPYEAGVWKGGEYKHGDGVTYDGSFWIAQKDTTARPGTPGEWRLVVKRGKDGKDGKDGSAGPQGERGMPGRDGRS